MELDWSRFWERPKPEATSYGHGPTWAALSRTTENIWPSVQMVILNRERSSCLPKTEKEKKRKERMEYKKEWSIIFLSLSWLYKEGLDFALSDPLEVSLQFKKTNPLISPVCDGYRGRVEQKPKRLTIDSRVDNLSHLPCLFLTQTYGWADRRWLLPCPWQSSHRNTASTAPASAWL